MEEEIYYQHLDGTVVKSFDEAVNYWEENYFDDFFVEVTEECSQDYLKQKKKEVSNS